VIRIVDQVVIDWFLFVWEHEGRLVEQVQACLLNGMILILNADEFFHISDDGGW
jgi:hypothetical protein